MQQNRITNPKELIERLKAERKFSWRNLEIASGISHNGLMNIHTGRSAGSRDTVRRLQTLYYDLAPKRIATSTKRKAPALVATTAARRPDVAPIRQRELFQPTRRAAVKRKVKKSQPGVSSLGLLVKGIFTPPTPAPQPTEHQRPYQEYNQLPNVARRPRRI